MPSKLQRWTDLIAALLTRRYPVTFDHLATEVPAYAEGLDPAQRETVKRMFERDKDELKSFGIHIEVHTFEEGESTGYRYRLNPSRFYLPFVTMSHGAYRVARPEGYRSLPDIQFDPDEVAILVHALRRLDTLGDPVLCDDARAARAKIAFDLPTLPDARLDVTILGDDRVRPSTFDTLTHALRGRKSVVFEYRAPGSDTGAVRQVRPYGLFFVHAHWYLAGFDEDREAVRNFRVSRMSALNVNSRQPHTPDFDIPVDFRLQEHAQSRAAWDLGEGEPLTAEVRFIGSSGAARAAESSGSEPESHGERHDRIRQFQVRRVDTFARWLLSFAGEAVPMAPPELVSAWRQLAAATLRVYDRT